MFSKKFTSAKSTNLYIFGRVLSATLLLSTQNITTDVIGIMFYNFGSTTPERFCVSQYDILHRMPYKI